MASLRLRPTTPEEFADWRTVAVAAYAEDKVESGAWPPADALARSAADYDSLLPAGLDTPDMVFWSAFDADTGERVGFSWVGLHSLDDPGTAWLYDIEVLAGHRGSGYGRALLAATEAELVRRGGTALGLNVFGQNTTAQKLYGSAGYEVVAQQMRKQLAGPQSPPSV